jgi:hypothetical protein
MGAPVVGARIAGDERHEQQPLQQRETRAGPVRTSCGDSTVRTLTVVTATAIGQRASPVTASAGLPASGARPIG